MWCLLACVYVCVGLGEVHGGEHRVPLYWRRHPATEGGGLDTSHCQERRQVTSCWPSRFVPSCFGSKTEDKKKCNCTRVCVKMRRNKRWIFGFGCRGPALGQAAEFHILTSIYLEGSHQRHVPNEGNAQDFWQFSWTKGFDFLLKRLMFTRASCSWSRLRNRNFKKTGDSSRNKWLRPHNPVKVNVYLFN